MNFQASKYIEITNFISTSPLVQCLMITFGLVKITVGRTGEEWNFGKFLRCTQVVKRSVKLMSEAMKKTLVSRSAIALKENNFDAYIEYTLYGVNHPKK